MAAKSFDAFMKAVDAAVIATVGLSVHDLADYAFYDAFEAGESAKSVAKAVLAEAGWEG